MATHGDGSLDHRLVDHIRATSLKQGKPYLVCVESHPCIARPPDPLRCPLRDPLRARSQRSTIDPFPWKSTRGAARTAGFSTSKYSARWNPNIRATTFGGNVSTFVFNVRTFAL